MAYNELIKNFNRIRAYLREFYVYGFRSRDEFDAKSARSYDNERRRVESWLGEYMRFRQDENGKQFFLSLDSRSLTRNPMYKAFKAKVFTDIDIVFHFCLLDMLSDGSELTSREVTDRIVSCYMNPAESELVPDESTIRKKLKEYEGLGLLCSRKRGREVCYRLSRCETDLTTWQDALQFFTEDAPCGVIGEPLLKENPAVFGFKHRYLLGALDVEIMLSLFESMNQGRAVELSIFSRKKNVELQHPLFPVRFYFSTQTGRQYILGYHYRLRKPMFFRLDSIRSVKMADVEMQADQYREICAQYASRLWGVSPGRHNPLEHFEMDIHVGADEEHIPGRLRREGRQGSVIQIDEETWRFSVDVCDTMELLPWVRTFIGRIVRVDCSNASVLQTLREDIQAMAVMYGGEQP